MFRREAKWVVALFSALVVSQMAWSQQASPDVEKLDETPVFTVTTVARTTNAVNYRYRRSNTDVDFLGTALAPAVVGTASIKSRAGSIEIDASLEGLKPASEFGAEYLTYVLWAITPQGRATNLGEVLINNRGRARLTATSELQTFAMVLTAEPYFTVRRPSDLVVAENAIREKNKGDVQLVETEYELFRRGDYAKLSNVLQLTVDLKRYPLDLYQARNAIQIAGGLRAGTYATETLDRAIAELDRAEALARQGKSKRDVSTIARNVVQIAEDARELTERRIEEELAENQRIAAEEARVAAVEATEQQRQEAELRAKAEEAQSEAERRSLEAQLAEARTRAEMEKALRQKEEAERMITRAKLDAEEARQEQEKAAAAVALMRAERLELEEARDAADLAARLATEERDTMRDRMQDALSKVVATQESARGLILNLPDILFDFGKATLRPEAREVLSRIAGIMMVTPGYRLLIEGHTDSVGSDEFNQKLSEDRAADVYNYFGSVDVSEDLMTMAGFGKSRPMATNDTPEGRQQNRRVEIIIQDENSEE